MHCASFNCVFFAFQIRAFTRPLFSRLVLHCFFFLRFVLVESVLSNARKKMKCPNDRLLKSVMNQMHTLNVAKLRYLINSYVVCRLLLFYIYLFFFSTYVSKKRKEEKKRLFGFNKQKWPYHNDRAKTRTQMRAHTTESHSVRWIFIVSFTWSDKAIFKTFDEVFRSFVINFIGLLKV